MDASPSAADSSVVSLESPRPQENVNDDSFVDQNEEGVPGENEVSPDSEDQGVKVSDCLKAWRAVALTTSREKLDTEAIALADRKEDYVSRRKALSNKVKGFTATFLSADADNIDVHMLRSECKKVINLFKGEFDHVANMMKSTEAAFLSMYLLLRDAPDPYPVLEQLVRLQLSHQLELDETRARLAAANASSTALEQRMTDENQIEDMKKGIQETLELEFREEKERLEEELRRREVSLRKQYESRDHDVQQSFQAMMAAKDTQLAQLLNTAEQTSLRINEYMERDHVLSAQLERQSKMDDKISQLTIELNRSAAKIVELEEKLASLNNQHHNRELAAANDAKKQAENCSALERQLQIFTVQTANLEAELQCRPPVNLAALALNLGIPTLWVEENGDINSGLTEDDKLESCVPTIRWSQIEDKILQAIRAARSEASECRSREAEAQQNVREMNRKISDLTGKLVKREESIASLEGDLQSAQAALLLKSAGKMTALNDSTRSLSGMGMSKPLDLNSFETASADIESNVGTSLMQTVQGQRDRLGKLAQEHEKEAIMLRSSLQRTRDELKEAQSDNVELFKRLRIARAAGSVRPSAASSASHGQPSMGVDSRGNTIKPRSSRKKTGALTWNYNDGGNVEEAAIPAPPSFSILGNSGGKFGEDSADDALEGKYIQLYEAQLDPFKVEEVDRQIVMSRLNILDWGLANVARILLKDQWTRYALMLYIFLVHIFASGYVIQVLNPEIVSEIGGQGGGREIISSTVSVATK